MGYSGGTVKCIDFSVDTGEIYLELSQVSDLGLCR